LPLLEKIGRRLAGYLNQPSKSETRGATCKPEQLTVTLRKGDVLLIDGSSRFSTAVKYLSQSTWSHAALYISDKPDCDSSKHEVLEADILDGVCISPVSKYTGMHTRICRPIGLTEQEINSVVESAVSRVGHQYDLKNIIDLARYLIQTPPVPTRWRRRMFALGSGDPTRAICSSLIAQAFQSVRYPILPECRIEKSSDPECPDCYDEFLHIRHNSLFSPRDFDISPYFQIIKPNLENGFDPHKLKWGDMDIDK
jgi:hypothetical protein